MSSLLFPLEDFLLLFSQECRPFFFSSRIRRDLLVGVVIFSWKYGSLFLCWLKSHFSFFPRVLLIQLLGFEAGLTYA